MIVEPIDYNDPLSILLMEEDEKQEVEMHQAFDLFCLSKALRLHLKIE